MVQQIYHHIKDINKICVIDPFVGSGTTLLETASFFTPNFKRQYCWLQFKNKPKVFNSDSWIKNFRWVQNLKNVDLMGIDIDENAIENLKQNSLLFANSYPEISLQLKTIVADSTELKKEQLAAMTKPCWAISNPPYGVRLAQSSVHQAFRHLESLVDLAGAVVLHPETMVIDFRNLKLSSQIDFSNQGLKLKLSVFTR